MKILSPTVHGALDYVVVLLFAVAPTVFGFTGVPATLAYVLAGVHLVMTLCTKFPLGIVKLVPFPIHGMVEVAVVFGLAAAPWLLGFADVLAARNFYLGAAALIAVVVVLTNYRGVPTTRTAHV